MKEEAYMERIILGGGCFWCIEAGFRLIRGVDSAVSGYAGGRAEDANYHAVSTGKTGHIEVVAVTFDPKVLTLVDVLDLFWALHNPTTPNQQGADIGPQYQSAIFYEDAEQLGTIEHSIEQVQQLWSEPIVTEVKPLERFYPAEEYHQDYYNQNSTQGYCQVVINPKLIKLKEKFAAHMTAQ